MWALNIQVLLGDHKLDVDAVTLLPIYPSVTIKKVKEGLKAKFFMHLANSS